MEAKAVVRAQAVVIDDAYARPSPEDLRKSLQTLRRFLRVVPAAKDWFDDTFGLVGSAQGRSYFDPLLQNSERVLELWNRRAECPEAERFLTEGLPDLVGEVAPLRQPLVHIEEALASRNWDIQRFPSLPELDRVPNNVELVVIDYVLTPDTPSDMVAKIGESTRFLGQLVQRAENTAGTKFPLVVLVSSRPAIERRHAESFRKSVGLQGAYFQFVRKKWIERDLGLCIDGFCDEAVELESYRNVHLALRKTLAEASASLMANVNALELQDIAALHVGHLIHEGEALSDYLGWMFGQVLTAKLQQAVILADASDLLPSENHRVLLGHLKPTQGIPKLFSELSSVLSAFGEMQKVRLGVRELRFGDVFAGNTSDGKIDTAKFLLVISQTCDLLQCKITNGQALCVEGYATLVEDSEAGLMKATLRQLDEKGSTLVQRGKQYYQIEWSEANLTSVPQTRLKGEKGYAYIGRLNEIYALEVQHNSLHRLGRIGVPVKPGYGVVFGVLKCTVWTAKGEVVGLSAALDSKTVVAVLRPREKGAVVVLLSGQAKKWMSERLTKLQAEATFPGDLKDLADKLVTAIGTPDFHLICKKTGKPGKGVLQVSRSVEKIDPVTNEKKKDSEVYNKLSMALNDASIFGEVLLPQGVRLQLEFDPIS